jgi:hypothetical protein
MKEMRKNINLIKPGYWIIVVLFVSLLISLFTRWTKSIDNQIAEQERIVAKLTARVEYATGDIQRRTSEYNQLYKLNGWAKKTLEALKKAKELNSKTIDANLDEMFVFTWSIY